MISTCLKYLILVVLLIACNNLSAGDAFKTSDSLKSGNLDVMYFTSDNFIESKNGYLTGIEYEILKAFQEYVLRTRKIDLELNFEGQTSFSKLYQNVKQPGSGKIGIASFSITEERLREVDFTPTYMPDVQVLMCSQNLPVLSDTSEFIKQLSNCTILTVEGTTFETDSKWLRTYLPNLKIEYVSTAHEIRQRVALEDNLLSYVELPNYLKEIKKGKQIKRQELFNVERMGYGFILPKNSDWDPIFEEYFSTKEFKLLVNRIIRKYLGNDVKELVWDVALKDVSSSEGEIALLTKEKEFQSSTIQKQDRERILFFAVIAAVIAFLFASFLALKNKNKTNRLLELKNDEIKDQRNKIQEVNKNLTDSIVYAEHIQSALFPHKDFLADHFEEQFVLFEPRDIVSGDFYWFDEIDDKIIIVLADCTGHGVPGAMLSMMGINYLNSIVAGKEIISPEKALSAMDNRILEAFRRSGSNKSDGMDIVFVTIDRKNMVLEFSGGKNCIIHIRGGETTKIKGEKFAVGNDGFPHGDYTKRKIDLLKGDSIYLYTDGFIDQFGGPNDKKYKSKNLIKLIEKNIDKPFSQQNKIYRKELFDWMGDTEQIDDISLIGFKV